MELKSHVEAPEAASPDPHAELWADLARAGDASAFCQAWLNIQCASAPGARAGIVLMECEDRSFAPVAIWPAGPCDVTPLKEVAEEALTTGRAAMRGAPEESGRTHVAYPVTAGEHICGVVVLDLDGRSAPALQETLRNIHWGVGWIASMGWRHRAEEDQKRLKRGAAAVDLLAVAQEHSTLEASAMAIANELALQLGVDRVAIGRLVKGDIKILAMSHGAWFKKRSDAVDVVEAAMEEALDQKSTIVFPPPPGPTRITLAHGRLAGASHAQHLASVLVSDRGETTGVITLERKEGEPFSPDELLMCEAMAAMVGPAIEMRAREQRWISGRIRGEAHKFLEGLVGTRRPVV